MPNTMEQCIEQLRAEAARPAATSQEDVQISVSLFTGKPMTSARAKAQDCFILNYVYQGSVHHVVDGEDFFQPSGTLFMTPPGVLCSIWRRQETDTVFQFFMKRDAVYHLFVFMLDNAPLLPRFFINGLYGKPAQPLLLQGGPQAEELLQQAIIEYCHTTMLSQEMLAALILQCLIHAVRISSGPPSCTRYSDKLFRILSFIDNHCATVTFAQLAEHFHYSQGYLARLLKAKTGHTFTELIQHRKMLRAKMLLAHSDIPVSQVALAVGYTDLGHFYRLFKKKYGLSPADFRKTIDNTPTNYLAI